jgi:GNAT superfamily N-acetyltransferase
MGGEQPPLGIRVRRATTGDMEAIVAFTSATWDGWDYLPEVLGAWLQATDGVVLVAEATDPGAAGVGPGQPIAVGRLAVLSGSEGWMEGLRVDPRIRGRGVATAFQLAELAWAQAQGLRVVRYTTAELNEASLGLGRRHGFAEVGRWRAIRPAEDDARRPASRAAILARLAKRGLVAAAAGAAWSRLRRDDTFIAGRRLYEWRPWAWQALGPRRFFEHGERGELLTAGDGRTFGLLGHERVAGETRLLILGGDPEAALGLVTEVARAAGRRPVVRLPDPSPLLDGLVPALGTVGWRVGEHVLVIMARALRDGSGRRLPLPLDGSSQLELAERPRRLGA